MGRSRLLLPRAACEGLPPAHAATGVQLLRELRGVTAKAPVRAHFPSWRAAGNSDASTSHPWCRYVFYYSDDSQRLWIRGLVHLPFLSRNRNIISVPGSCVNRKETPYRYREVQ